MSRPADAALAMGWRFAAIVCVGLLPWPGVQQGCSALFRPVANLVLTNMEFGAPGGLGTGHVRLLAATRAHVQRADDGPAWDTVLELRVTGVDKVQTVFVSPRRSFYLPLLFLLASIGVVPLPRRRKWLCAGVGVSLLVAYALGTLCLTSMWIFARVPGLVYTLTPVQQLTIELAYRGLVTPMSHRIVVPLLVACGLLSWQWLREQRARAQLGGQRSRQ